jgi:hypothetical protein
MLPVSWGLVLSDDKSDITGFSLGLFMMKLAALLLYLRRKLLFQSLLNSFQIGLEAALE